MKNKEQQTEGQKYRFHWIENGIRHEYHEHGEKFFDTYEEGWAAFKEYVLEHLTLGSNRTGANGWVHRVGKGRILANLVDNDILYLATFEPVNAGPGDLTRQLMEEKGLVEPEVKSKTKKK